MTSKSIKLNEADIKSIQELAYAKLGICKKTHDIIGTQVFSILARYARVIYYPLGENAPWGFTHVIGSKSEKASTRPFVAINTSIPEDCQVFAAAHELYHIWFDLTSDIISSNILDDHTQDINELKANRFAAEFLIEEGLLKQEISLYGFDVHSLKDILKMAELFSVPYRTMVRRLYEIHKINKNAEDKFLKETKETIAKYRKRYSVPEPAADHRIVMDNLAELSADAYDKRIITYEKLDYLLSLCAISPADIGFSAPTNITPPTDEELDAIMEE